MAPKRFIYFAHCHMTGLVKIGVTTNVAKRVRHLKVECGFAARLLSSRKGTTQDEVKLKREFADYHAGHEWFRVEGALRDYLRTEIWGMKLPEHDPANSKVISLQNRRYAKTIRRGRKTLAAMLDRVAAGSG